MENFDAPNGRRLRRVEFNDDFFSTQHRGRGLVSGDLDQDGDLDLIFSHVQEPVAILRNDTKSSGQQIQVELVGVDCNRDAIGAVGVLETNRRKYLRCVVGGGSYLSQFLTNSRGAFQTLRPSRNWKSSGQMEHCKHKTIYQAHV